jgi:cell division septation protein DedD
MLFTSPVLGLERFFAKTETLPGLNVAAFNIPQGTIRVYLPDDMDTGDVISGTVVIEPAGKTEEEQQRNRDELNRYWVELENDKSPVIQKNLRWNIPDALTGWVSHLILRDGSGEEVARTIVSVEDVAPTIERTITPASWEYQFPIVGHAGNPVQIKGPFDGNLGTTELKIGGKEARILAESPRKLVFESPRDILGPTQIELRERNITVRRNFTNLRVVKIEEETPPMSLAKQPITKVETEEEGTKKERPLVNQTPIPIRQPEVAGVLKEEELPLSSPHTREPKKVENQKEKLMLAAPKPQPTPASIQPKAEIETEGIKKEESLKKPTPTPLKQAEEKERSVAEIKELASTSTDKEPIVEAKKEEAIKEEKLLTKQTPAPVEQKAKLRITKAKQEEPPQKDVTVLSTNREVGKYTVQVASFKKESEAQEFAEGLKSKGYPVFIKQAEIPGRGIWYRVRIGTFKTIQEAKIYGNDLKKREKEMSSLIITVNN